MTAPLLDVDRLTVRFGGLTAVNQVDLQVHPGKIVAVIGPNGAGKTTLFNAISGVSPMTDGSIRFDGKQLARQAGRRQYVGWSVLGITCGLAMLAFVADPDELWSVGVRGNFSSRAEGFAARDAVRDVVAHVSGLPPIERRAGSYFVTLPDGRVPFPGAASKAEARRQRDAILEAGASGDSAAPVLGVSPEREIRLSAARLLSERGRRARWLHLAAFLVGAAIGGFGGYTVFRQSRRTPAWIAAQGIARTFQNIRLFKDMTVLENLLVGLRNGRGQRPRSWLRLPARDWAYAISPLLIGVLLVLVGALVRVEAPETLSAVLLAAALLGLVVYAARLFALGAFVPGAVLREAEARDEAARLLEFVGLGQKGDALAKNLAYGDQRRLEIGRALATKPRLLLLDEPAAGMNPREALNLVELIRQIRESGVTVLLIEHHMRVVMGISDRVAVLQYGKKIADGTPEEVKNSPEVIEAYLGKEELG